MKTTDIRRNNLIKLLTAAGERSDAMFAQKWLSSITPNYLSQLKTGSRPIGEKKAREIEYDLALPKYWMDDANSIVDLKKHTDSGVSLVGTIPGDVHEENGFYNTNKDLQIIIDLCTAGLLSAESLHILSDVARQMALHHGQEADIKPQIADQKYRFKPQNQRRPPGKKQHN